MEWKSQHTTMLGFRCLSHFFLCECINMKRRHGEELFLFFSESLRNEFEEEVKGKKK